MTDIDPEYLPGFNPTAADRYYGATISKLLRENENWKQMSLAHGAAIRMVRDAIEQLFGPAANIESEEATLLRGPEPHHDAEAIIQALQNIAGSHRTEIAEMALRFRAVNVNEMITKLGLTIEIQDDDETSET